MKLLAIETSTSIASVAVSVSGTLLSEEQGAMRQHAQVLLPMIERLLHSASVGIAELDGIVFGCGPGSFTGLRIACSVAKGLAYGHDLPLYPASTLAAVAQEALKHHDGLKADVLSILDARMEQIYWCAFDNRLAPKAEECVSNASEVIVSGEHPVILAGVDFDTYESQLPNALQQRIVSRLSIPPHARAMIEMTQAGLIAPVRADSALPVYVRNKVTHGESNG